MMITKKKNFNRHICHILITTMLAVLLCGCASAQQDMIFLESDAARTQAADKTIVTFFGFKADDINLIAIEKALGEFMDLNPDIYVTYEGIKGQPYWNAFDLRNRTGYLDDIIMLDHEHILELSEKGQLADLSSLSTLDHYIPWARSQFTDSDGSVYFLPTCIATYNLYINTDLLKQHGQSIPTNLKEFSQVCDYFAGQGITPIIANNYGSVPTLITAKSMYDVYAAEDADAQIEKFNSGEADLAEQQRPGVEFAASMLQRGWIDGAETAATNQTSDDLALFSEGKRPFMISGGWASVRLDVDFSYGVYPYPIMEDGSVVAMGIDTCIGVNAKSEHIHEAMKLVEFLTQPDVMWDYCDSQCSYSPLTDKRTPSDATIAPSAPYLTNGRSALRSDYNLNFPLESALRECTTMILSGADTDSVMETLRKHLYPDTTGGNAP